ncbi:putative homing endonuclease [Burkholderia phage BcepSaruman]|uniref:Putative homing endonuclease n=1 Tax=Burkholderia phage BcepSaruman TaxID=2530032 RepID=A0A4D5ZE87_9CAUD|nr:putative homing endonuclease [Burkholderia phage BcepSaruman]QBX06577.1 putative homing endonuclease [Burkholderia phage BcepSaruman]
MAADQQVKHASTAEVDAALKTYVAGASPGSYVGRVAAKARALHEQAAASMRRKSLSLEPRYYVYALLNPSRPGPFLYTLPAGKRVTLTHEPFYVGKGTGGRLNDHADHARLNPVPEEGKFKANVIRKLHRDGVEPIAVQLTLGDIEAVALAKECFLIAAIGRRDVGLGPLTNGTDGGEGGSHVVQTEAIRARRSAALKGKPKSASHRARLAEASRGQVKTPEAIAKQADKIRGRPKSEEHRAKLREAALKRWESKENREQQSLKQKGREFSDETRALMSAAQKRRTAEGRNQLIKAAK